MHTQGRHLAAVLFADIAGYTSMMQSDEPLGLKTLGHFEDSVEKAIINTGGEVVKKYGDGALLLFDSAKDAVDCAILIQKDLRKEPQVPLRIGIHIGEIVRRDQDIFGDTVNITSRIESMGVPNSVLVSENIHQLIKNKPELKTTDLGEFKFKNVDKPMRLYAIANEGLTIPRAGEMKGKGVAVGRSAFAQIKFYHWITAAILIILGGLFTWNKINSARTIPEGLSADDKINVAVFPFEIRAGEELLHWSEGIMDLINSGIDGILNLRSMDETIVMSQFQNQTTVKMGIFQKPIWSRYKVDYFIKGSLVDLGGQLKLISSLHDNHGVKLSSKEVEIDSLAQLKFGLNKNIKDVITQILLLEDLPEEMTSINADLDLESLKDFLEAEQQYRRSNYHKAIDLYDKVIEVDSNFAQAYLGKANALLQIPEADFNQVMVNIAFAFDKKDNVTKPIQNLIVAKYNLIVASDIPKAVQMMKEAIREYGPNINLYKELALTLMKTNFIYDKSINEARFYLEESLEYDSTFQLIISAYIPILLRSDEKAKAVELLKDIPEQSDIYWEAQSYSFYLQDSTDLTLENLQVFKQKIDLYPATYPFALLDFNSYKKFDAFVNGLGDTIMDMEYDRFYQSPYGEWLLLKGMYKAADSFWSEFDLDCWYNQFYYPDPQFFPRDRTWIDTCLTIPLNKKRTSWALANKTLLNARATDFTNFEESMVEIITKKDSLKNLFSNDTFLARIGPRVPLLVNHKEHWLRFFSRQINYNYHKLKSIHYRVNENFDLARRHLDSIYRFGISTYGSKIIWLEFYALKYLEAEIERADGKYKNALEIYDHLLEISDEPEQISTPSPLYFGPVHLRKAQCYEALGDKSLALEYYIRFLYIYGDCDEFWQHNVRFAQARRDALIQEMN